MNLDHNAKKKIDFDEDGIYNTIENKLKLQVKFCFEINNTLA